MSLGLRESDINEMNRAFKRFPEIEEVVIFGSRAKGTYKRGSDVDLALFGPKVNFNTISKLHFWLNEESSMPYTFDVVWFEQLDNTELKEHIMRVGKIIYKLKLEAE